MLDCEKAQKYNAYNIDEVNQLIEAIDAMKSGEKADRILAGIGNFALGVAKGFVQEYFRDDDDDY